MHRSVYPTSFWLRWWKAGWRWLTLCSGRLLRARLRRLAESFPPTTPERAALTQQLQALDEVLKVVRGNVRTNVSDTKELTHETLLIRNWLAGGGQRLQAAHAQAQADKARRKKEKECSTLTRSTSQTSS